MNIHDEITELASRAALNGPEQQSQPRSHLYEVISDLTAETLPDPKWAIQQLYPENGFVVVYGARGKGKTFLALGWSFSHASGLPWLGRAVNQPGPVIYIMAEGRGGLGARVRAQKEHLGLSGETGVYFLPTAVPMLTPTEVNRLIRTIESLHITPAITVWDTLSRTFVGGDENSSKDMALYVEAIDYVKKTVGGGAIVEHHSGHYGERERGSTVLGGAADTFCALRENDGVLELTCEKQKDAEAFQPIPLVLKKVGKSCILTTAGLHADMAEKLTPLQTQLLHSLQKSFAVGEEVSANRWKAVSGLPDRTFFAAAKALVDGLYVGRIGTKNASRYVVLEAGPNVP